MNFFSSTLAGVAASKTNDSIDGVTGNVPHLEEHGECLHQDVHDIKHYLAVIAAAYVEQKLDYYEILTIPAGPNSLPLPKHGYKYNAIFFPNSTTQFTLKVIGVGSLAYTPTASGWISLDLPDNSEIAVTNAAAINVLYRCSDNSVGNVI